MDTRFQGWIAPGPVLTDLLSDAADMPSQSQSVSQVDSPDAPAAPDAPDAPDAERPVRIKDVVAALRADVANGRLAPGAAARALRGRSTALVAGSPPPLPPPHPDLASRLERLRAAAGDAEYARMVARLPEVQREAEREMAGEVATLGSQLSIGVNIIVSMAVMYAFGYTLGNWGWGGVLGPHLLGLAATIAIMLIEMWLFILRDSVTAAPKSQR